MRLLKDTFLIPLLLILIQVLVLNQMHVVWYATPFLYIWFILRMPNEFSRTALITLGFIYGLILDLFSNTPGMHAFALATLAFLKAPILYLYVGREDFKTGVCSIRTMGIGAYLRFLVTATLLFCAVIFTLEAFTLFSAQILMLKIGLSTLTTVLLILGVESLKPKVR